MARKQFSDEDVLKLLRQIEFNLSSGSNTQTACRSVGISTATYYNWRRRYGGMGRSQLSQMKDLEKENKRVKKILAELELDKLILKESLDFLNKRSDSGSVASGRYPCAAEFTREADGRLIGETKLSGGGALPVCPPEPEGPKR